MESAKTTGKNLALLITSIIFSLLVLIMGALTIFYWDISNEFDDAIARSEKGDSESLLMAAMMLEAGWINKPNYKASELYMKSARMGDKTAQFMVCAKHQDKLTAYMITEQESRQWCP